MKNVICTLTDDANFEQVKEALQKAGLTVTGAFDKIGSLAGTVDESLVEELANVPGVYAVEDEQTKYTTQEVA